MEVRKNPSIFIFIHWWCALFEVMAWFLLVVGVFAVLNRIWLWVFLKAETSRLEGRDAYAEVSTFCTDPRAARSI